MELRTNLKVKVDARAADAGDFLDGYAAVFNEPTIIWDFEETIAPGAFSRALKEKQDVRSLFNHDPNYPLARTKNGTLILREDKTGLWTESSISKTNTKSQDVLDHVRRGDVDGMSFAFTVRKQEWIFQELGSELLDRRVITEIGVLYDIGPVTYPAYEQTSIKVREAAKKMHQEARSRWESRRSTFQVPAGFDLVCREARGAGADEAWAADAEKDHEFREKLRSADPDENKEAENDKPSTPPAEGEGEKAPETSGEGEKNGEGEAGGSPDVQPEAGEVDPLVEACSREAGIRAKVRLASQRTRSSLGA